MMLNIRVLKKAIRANNVIVEVVIINLLVSLDEITFWGGPNTLYKITLIALLRN
jgi:hypothetical protein